MAGNQIENVSDTALWVAVYRAQEGERANPLFKDPLAARLAGARGFEIAKGVTGPQYTAWSLVIRTVVIDRYIQSAIAAGIDTVVNLGAGLDTRPYRLELPPELHWIEVDFAHLIQHKETVLAQERPACRLERISLDLSDRVGRRELFKKIASESKRALILTEGVILYLENQQVAELAEDLRAHPQFALWIIDYLSKRSLAFVRKRRKKELKNAPMVFDPANWFGFFKERGWKVREIQYLPEVSQMLGRKVPMPWFARLLSPLMSRKMKDEMRQYLAYALLEHGPRP